MAYSLGGVEQAQAEARTAALQAGQTSASAISLPNILKDSLSKLFAKDNPLYQQREQALETYYAAPEAGEERIREMQAGGTLFTPVQQRQLIAQQRAAAVSPLTTVNDLIQLGIGGIGDVVSRAGTTFQGAAAAAQSRAGILAQLAQQRMQLYQQQVQEEQFRQQLAAASARAGGPTWGQQRELEEERNYKTALNAASKELQNLAATAQRKGVKFSSTAINRIIQKYVGKYPEYSSEIVKLGESYGGSGGDSSLDALKKKYGIT